MAGVHMRIRCNAATGFSDWKHPCSHVNAARFPCMSMEILKHTSMGVMFIAVTLAHFWKMI